MSEPIGDLSNRMRDIFRLVVEAYLARGTPVGSKMLAGSVSLSPASIRGVMQELEERGLLSHPHTSAGRVPTETGLRLFVDGIMHSALPRQRERAAIEAELKDRPIEEALGAAMATLVGAVGVRRGGARAQDRISLAPIEFRPARPRSRAGRARRAPMAASRIASSRCPPGPARSRSPRSAIMSARACRG